LAFQANCSSPQGGDQESDDFNNVDDGTSCASRRLSHSEGEISAPRLWASRRSPAGPRSARWPRTRRRPFANHLL